MLCHIGFKFKQKLYKTVNIFFLKGARTGKQLYKT